MYDDIPATYWDENKNSGWYECKLLNNESPYSSNYIQRYCDVVYWLKEHIPMCYRHTRWTADETGIRVRFRYERDYIMFTLRWS